MSLRLVHPCFLGKAYFLVACISIKILANNRWPHMDFTFDNPLIAAYFAGSDDYIPTAELIYLHEHPLVKESFLREIERKINNCAHVATEKRLRGQVLQKFINYTIALGQALPSLSNDNAPQVLELLRGVNSLSDGLLQQYNL